jgi:CRP-like cAMP-binding protein
LPSCSSPWQSVLLLQGEPASRFFVVQDGWVRLYLQTPQGLEVTIAVFGRSDSFAEAGVLQMMPFPVSAPVIADSRHLVILADSFIAPPPGEHGLLLQGHGRDGPPPAGPGLPARERL